MTGLPDAASPPTGSTGSTGSTDETVKVGRDGQVAAADISTSLQPDGVTSVALRAPHDVSPETRGELVDRVMEHPAVQSGDTVRVVVPLGDGASISRLQERTTNATARAAGASSIVEAEVAHPTSDD